MKKVIIVGSLNTDLVINAPYAPQGGETLMGSDFMINQGGKGANQAYATAALGGNAYMCGCVGDDSFGTDSTQNLNKVGVNTDFVRRVSGVPTGVAVIVVTQGENRIIIDSGANGHLSTCDIDRVLEVACEGDIYLTQLENPIDVIGYGLKKAKEKGLLTVLNPAPANRDILKYAQCVDIITPNETESEILGEELTITESIVEYVKANVEEILVIVATALGSFFAARWRNKTNGDLATLNNNSIAMAKNSSDITNKALEKIENAANVVTNFNDKVDALLAEIRKSDDEKKSLEDKLNAVDTFINATKLAVVELASEVANLLLLANIPNAKKTEMYSDHLAALKAIADVESKEVTEDVNEA